MENKIEIRHVSEIQESEAMPLLMAGAAELAQAGYTRYLNLASGQSAFYAVADGLAVAAVSYRKYDHDGSVFVHLGFVLPEYRRRGIYTRLLKCVVRKASEIGGKYVELGVHLENKVSQAAHEAAGFGAFVVTYRHPVHQPTVVVDE